MQSLFSSQYGIVKFRNEDPSGPERRGSMKWMKMFTHQQDVGYFIRRPLPAGTVMDAPWILSPPSARRKPSVTRERVPRSVCEPVCMIHHSK